MEEAQRHVYVGAIAT